MSKSRHSEAQIIGALKQVEGGRKVEDVARLYMFAALSVCRSVALAKQQWGVE